MFFQTVRSERTTFKYNAAHSTSAHSVRLKLFKCFFKTQVTQVVPEP